MITRRSFYRVPAGLSKVMFRIFTILRTRKVYGYNSVVERIFRCIVSPRRNRPRAHEGKSRIDMERV